MSDQAAPGVVPPPTEVVQGNAEAARTPEGAIKDQQGTQPQGIPDPAKAKTSDPAATTTDDKKPDDKAAKPDPDAVPEKYELKAPEGKELDAKLVEEVTPMFKELKLTQDQAQKLTDFWNKHVGAAADNAYKAYEDMRTANRELIVKDPTLGNGMDGFKPEVKANIAKVMDAIGSPAEVKAFKEAMDFTGAGDNPAFAKAFNNLGKLLSEGSSVRGGGPASTGQDAPGKAPPSPAQALYPNNPSSARS